MALFPSSNGTSYRRKSFGNINITVLNNETFLVGGRVSGTFALSGWTTIATITDSDYIPSSTIRGVAVDANWCGKTT